MAQHDLLHGRNFIIKLDGELLALSKSCTVDVQSDTTPVSGPTTGKYEDYLPGRIKWEVTCSHLMYNRGATKPLDRMDLVGQIVSLAMDIVYEDTAKFYDFKDDVSSVSTDYPTVDVNSRVYFDTVRKQFVCLYNNVYYIQWKYTDGRLNLFTNVDSSIIYERTHGVKYDYYKAERSGLVIEITKRDTTRQGQAIIRQWSGTFSWGNVSQGSYKFLGKGPLGPVPEPEEEEEEEE